MNTQDSAREAARETDTFVLVDGVEVLVSSNSDYMPIWPPPWDIKNSDPA